MNKLRYQTFLLTRVLQGNAYPSTAALLAAIDEACAIPETEWNARKAAFNAINDKAPLRSGKTNLLRRHRRPFLALRPSRGPAKS